MPKAARKSPKRRQARDGSAVVLARPVPSAAANAVLDGRDAILMLPSGGASGWLETAVEQGRRRALLVVPAELLGEREARLRPRAPVVRLEALLRPPERRGTASWAAARGPLIVMADPETLLNEDAAAIASRVRPDCVVVEQAQRVSARSPDYDPLFAGLANLIGRLAPMPRVMVVGPAHTQVRSETAELFGLREPLCLAAPARPPGATLEVMHAARGDAALADRIASLPRPGVVFCATPQDADLAYAELRARRVPVHRYHAAMSAGERGGELIQFTLPGRRAVLVATSAFSPAPPGATDAVSRGFGLGFEERELCFVAHWQLPASLEQYTREIALAARSSSATCLLGYDPIARRVAEAELRAARPGADVVQVSALALAEQGAGGYTTLERLALSARLGRRSVELAVGLLARAGLVKYGSGWVRTRLSGTAYAARVTSLVRTLDELCADDARRLDAMVDYAGARACLAACIDRYFGVEGSEVCGRCSVCQAPAGRGKRHGGLKRVAGARARER